ncbi:serine/threonine-protein kinase [Tahibacter aquaticus]|uniref:Serine/threonine-protein kinase n=1 Tax=Tahibacter aquaticus TaxID=520092 RepID=A0A4R6YWW0_9GAMM|nr:serine/threonine-protein kinase [Tahibacter aquaticus]TDR43132.1 serine/threonine-protein kinase [Tahibacter aquaticus]
MAADAVALAALDELLLLGAPERAAALQRWRREQGDEFHEFLLRLLAADSDASDPLAVVVGDAMRTLDLPAQPLQLGAYRLLQEIGSGGMGTVFLAERSDGAYAQQVAIKLLRGFPTRDGMRRLRQERQILATLDHPCIARLLDGGETPAGQPWLALEYVAGLPLGEWVAQHSPSRGQRLQLFEHVLAAVQHAHQRLVVHRDLKPANILVRSDGMPRLLDFGIAKLVEGDDGTRDTSTRVMTPAWASPEQQAGRPITTASDIYTLGLLLRDLLLGADARGGTTALDAELRGVVARATATDPALRYASAEAFAEDLARYRSGRPLRASADTPLYRLRKFLHRHRLGVAMAAAALVLAGMFVWRLDAERRRAVVAEANAANALAQARRESARAVAVNDFLVSLFGQADPANNRGAKPDARTLLEQGAARIETELKDQPEIRAALQQTLALAMRGLGEHERAEHLIQASIAATSGDSFDIGRLRADRIALLASIRARSGNRSGALEAADQALVLLDRIGDEDAERRVELENTRAMALKWLDRTDEAALALERVLALLPRLGSREAEHRAYATDNLAHVREAQGRWDDAQQTAFAAAAAFRALRGNDSHPEPQAVSAYAASLLLMRGEAAAARGLYEKVLSEQRKLFEASDRRLTNTETGLARSLLRLGDAAAAKPLLDTALARCEKSFGDHVRCPLTLQIMGEWNNAYGDRALALTQLAEAVALREDDKEIPERSRWSARLALAVAECRGGEKAAAKSVATALAALLADMHVAPGDKRHFEHQAQACSDRH